MKINIVIGPFYPIPPVLGLAVERIQFALAREYARCGHEVTMVSRHYEDFPERETLEGVIHIRVPSSAEPAGQLKYRLLDLLYAISVRRVLPAADITVTNSVAAPLVMPKRAGRLHVSVGRFPKGQMGFYRRASRLLAPSRIVADAIREQSPGMADRVRVIGNPISHEFAANATRMLALGEPSPRPPEMIYLGRLAREKGVHHLITAFGRLADAFPYWRLSIIGPAGESGGGSGQTYLNELQDAAAPFGDRIRFDGPIYDTAVLIQRLNQASIFVYPSLAEAGETFGVAPVEAMACGCAVIVSGLKCFSDFIEPSVNGVVFDHRGDPVGAQTKAIAQLMQSETERLRLGRIALETALRFSPARIADQMLADFAELTSPSGTAEAMVP